MAERTMRESVRLNMGAPRANAARRVHERGSDSASSAIRGAAQLPLVAEDQLDHQARRAGPHRSWQAVPRPLTVAPPISACITSGTSFAQEPPPNYASWLEESDTIVAHQLSAVALELLNSLGSDHTEIDPELVTALREAALRDAMMTLSSEGTSAAVLRSLESHEIRFLIIKGPSAARFHPDPGKRTYSDLDLLVSPRRFGEAIEVLVELGYVRKRDSEPLWATFDRHCIEGFNFHLNPVGNIELHHHVSPCRFGKNLGFDTLYERSDLIEVAGVPVRFAWARDTLVISCLHVVNDLGKDNPSLNSWRDIAILFDLLHPRDFHLAFEDAGLSWFETYIRAGLADLGARIDETGRQGFDRHLRWWGERLRLGLMGWNGTSFMARHPLGWALRLPSFRALYFLLAAAIPSPRYVRGRYPNYRSYWHDAWSSMAAAAHGSDFRHERIGSTDRSAVRRQPSGDRRDID
jgi:hypothetical protein